MMKIPRVVRNSAMYSVVTLLQKSISFFLLPLYTAFLTPEDYGTVNVVLAVSSFMAVLIMMALNGAATRFHYKNNSEEYRKVLWGTVTTIVVVNSFAWGAVFFVFHRYLVDPFIGEVDFYPFAVLALANTAITPLYILFQSYLQASQKAGHYSINTFSNFLVQVSFAVLFIAHFRMGAVGMLLANVLTSLLFFIYVLITYIPHLKLCIDKSVARASFKYSLPLLPHQISLWSAGTIDRLFLNGIKGKAQTGIFSVSQQFGQVVGTIAFSVNQAFVPWFFETLEKGKEGIPKIQRMGNCCVFAYGIIALIISLFAPEILRIMVSENFRDAWRIIPFITFAFVFHGIYFFFINILFLKDTGIVFWVTMTAMFFDVLLNIIFVPIWGYYGCGLACLMTYFIRSLVALILSRKKNKEIKYNYFFMYGFTFMLFALSYSNLLMTDLSLGVVVSIKLGILFSLISWFYLNYHETISSFLKTRANKADVNKQ